MGLWRRPPRRRDEPSFIDWTKYEIVWADEFPGAHMHFGLWRAPALLQAEAYATAKLREMILTRVDSGLWRVWVILAPPDGPGRRDVLAWGTRDGTKFTIRSDRDPITVDLGTGDRSWHDPTIR